jgi:4-hydroxy-tetrahydrodipicolinate synthase
MEFAGNIVALVTPFRNGAVDREALAAQVERTLAGGVSAVVPCGTTGESPTLSHDEHDEVVELTLAAVRGRVPVIAGAGSNSTREAIRLTKAAEHAGADAVLSVNPYYNRPSQEGLVGHFLAIADATSLPIVLYNIPGRTGVELSIDTITTLARHPRIRAIKEATGNVDLVTQIRAGCDLAVLSGDDVLTLPMLALGASGVISVLSNLLPRDMTELVAAARSGDFATARERHERLHPLMRALFVETNPVPVKAAMAELGWIAADVRRPLAPLRPASLERLRAALAATGLR